MQAFEPADNRLCALEQCQQKIVVIPVIIEGEQHRSEQPEDTDDDLPEATDEEISAIFSNSSPNGETADDFSEIGGER